MIKEITDRISELIHGAFPDHVIYDDGQVPQNFSRPAFCIVSGKVKHTPLNIRVTEHDVTFTVYLFPVLDESGNAVLYDMQNELLRLCRLFRQGFIKVGTRAAKVKGAPVSDCSMQDGYAEIVLCYKDSTQEQTAQNMQNIKIK